MTHQHDPITTPANILCRLLVALAAIALLATACGSSGVDSATSSVERTDRSIAGDSAVRPIEPSAGSLDDAEAVFDTSDEAADEEEAMEDEEAFAEAEAALEAAASAEEAVAPQAEALVPRSAAQDAGVAQGVRQIDEAEEDDGDAEGLFSQPADRDDEQEFTTSPEAERLVDNRFQFYGYREFIEADDDPLSTFALDVDTGSYTVARRWLDEGVLPPPEAVRVEEFVNAFDYEYETPRRGLEISVDGGPSPFDDDNLLVRVGVQAEVIADDERPPVALTFIVDTSGSMDRDDRLGLVKDSLEILVDELEDDDTVAIVVYSNGSGVVLDPTPVSDSRRIYDAIDSLTPGGSTNLESGLVEGYELALESFRNDGVNRVIIASDGVANAGVTDQNQLTNYIRDFADQGIQLVTVGYGMGNFNDTLMEQLADNGDGFYAYIDTEDEAERLFEDELTSTLITAAIDAKIQVEFDTDVVDEYRLIGFENRGVRDNDFRNDSVDAGELGAGHQVTAMYEVNLHRGVDLDDRGDIGEVFLRWEDPDTGEVIEIDEDIDLRDVAERFSDTTIDYQLATVVTAFGEVMRDNPYGDDVDLSNIFVEAQRVADRMDTDQVDELVDLLGIAQNLAY